MTATTESVYLPSEANVTSLTKEALMLGWVLTFLVVSIVAGLFGFTGVAAGAAGIAQLLFFIFLVFLVISVVAWLTSGRRRRA